MKFNSNPLEPTALAISSPEFLTTNDVRKYFGIRKGTLYNLAKLGKVRGKALRVTGQFKGVRIWSVDSIRSFIDSQSSEVSNWSE
jgi:hypothetical protein